MQRCRDAAMQRCSDAAMQRRSRNTRFGSRNTRSGRRDVQRFRRSGRRRPPPRRLIFLAILAASAVPVSPTWFCKPLIDGLSVQDDDYTLANSTKPTKSACETACSDDVKCVGVLYDGGDDTCTQYNGIGRQITRLTRKTESFCLGYLTEFEAPIRVTSFAGNSPCSDIESFKYEGLDHCEQKMLLNPASKGAVLVHNSSIPQYRCYIKGSILPNQIGTPTVREAKTALLTFLPNAYAPVVTDFASGNLQTELMDSSNSSCVRHSSRFSYQLRTPISFDRIRLHVAASYSICQELIFVGILLSNSSCSVALPCVFVAGCEFVCHCPRESCESLVITSKINPKVHGGEICEVNISYFI